MPGIFDHQSNIVVAGKVDSFDNVLVGRGINCIPR